MNFLKSKLDQLTKIIDLNQKILKQKTNLKQKLQVKQKIKIKIENMYVDQIRNCI